MWDRPFLQIAQTPFSLNFYESARNLERTLLAGVTSVRDAGGADLGIKVALELGMIRGPRMQISVSIMSQTGGHGDIWFPSGAPLPILVPHPGRPSGICDGPHEVLSKTGEIIRAGADVIRFAAPGGVLSPRDQPTHSQFLPAELEVIVAEARAHGMWVMAHAQGASGIKNALRAGVRSIEHGAYLDEEAIELLREKEAFLVPTLVAPLGVLEKPEGVPEVSLQKAHEVVEIHRDSIRRAAEAGVKISMGTDSGIIAHGRNLEELIQMAEVGISPMQVIVASTKIAAENLGTVDRVGTIEPRQGRRPNYSERRPLGGSEGILPSRECYECLAAGRGVRGRRLINLTLILQNDHTEPRLDPKKRAPWLGE